MSLQPDQVKDLIVSACEKIKALKARREEVIKKIQGKFEKLRDKKSNSELDKKEKFAIKEQNEIYEEALKELTALLKNLKTKREKMISDLSLPPMTEEYLKSLNL